MRFIDQNADFSAAGKNIGNSNKAELFITLGGITSTSQKTAVRNLETSLKSAGMWTDFDVIRLFGFGSALPDSLNLKNPGIGSTYNQATFVNDSAGAHTSTGFVAAVGRYAQSNYTMPADLTNFHIHAYNETGETLSTPPYCSVGGLNGTNWNFVLARNYYSTRFQIGQGGNFSSTAPSGYDQTKTGLLSGAKVGTTLTLYDVGVQQSTTTTALTLVGGTTGLNEGAYSATVGSTATYRCILYGSTAWTSDKEAALKTIIDQFRTTMLS